MESGPSRDPQWSASPASPPTAADAGDDSSDVPSRSRGNAPDQHLESADASSASGTDDLSLALSDEDEADILTYDPTPAHSPYPAPKWFSVKQLQAREIGCHARSGVMANRAMHKDIVSGFQPLRFRTDAYSSIYFFQRLTLYEKLEEHNGCVNCLNFNASGDLICSGSDDLQIAIWDWQRNQLRHKYHSGHSSNVFNCKFCIDGNHIVSCARDGQVRICDVRNTTLTLSRKLAQHKASSHKLTLTSPHVILSCGEDGIVHEIDLRLDKPTKVLLVKDGDKKMPLYSINNCMAMNPFQFVTSGRSPNVHVYDRRFLTSSADSPAPLEKLCPPHLKGTSHTVTCAVYDSIGRSVLATYNDDDIYLFDSQNGHLEHSYKGHRNSATIKGVSWFTDNFIISGSDDGYVYGWDRETEHIVMSLYADEGGVVNCLEPHPTCPFLATSGLDDNVKMWIPSSNQWPQVLTKIKTRICTNMRDRRMEQRRAHEHDGAESVDSSVIWLIIRQLRERQRSALNAAIDSDDEDDDEEDAEQDETQQCIPS